MRFQLEAFSEGKNSDKNEDFYGYNDTKIILADGSSDKSGQLYRGKTGGEIISRMIVSYFLKTTKPFDEAIEELNNQINEFYKIHNPKAFENNLFRFASTLVYIEIKKEKIEINQISDTEFRINGSKIYKNPMLIDSLTSNLRAQYINITNDIEGSREFIFPILESQHKYMNNPNHPLGYGAVTGQKIPNKFIKKYSFDLEDVKQIEIFTDGYFDIPTESNLSSWESNYEKTNKEDPHKYKKFKSTKSKDDRTILIARL
jgi:hypothetical protein